MDTITISEYLSRKGIEFSERNGELITKCLFSDCDKDSRRNEAHLYFNTQTSQYDCKKCGATGNIFVLAKHLGDEIKDIALYPPKSTVKESNKKSTKNIALTSEYVETLHTALPDRIRIYLNSRGIPNTIINQFKLGWGEFYGRKWITIPVTDINSKYNLLKLRKDP